MKNKAKIISKLDQIKCELASKGIKPQSTRIGNSTGAFGGESISFDQWLINEFIPNATEASNKMELPVQSNVGIAALRNFNGDSSRDKLVNLLFDFDKLVNK